MRSEIVSAVQESGLPSWLVPDYLFMLTFSIIVGALFSVRLWKSRGEDIRVAQDLLFYGILGLLVGSRFLYFSQYGFPGSMRAWFGTAGFSLYGGLLGLLLVWSIYRLLRPYKMLQFLDCVTPSLALGLFLGRIGCFLAGCNGGIVSDLPWSISFPRHTATFFHQVEAGQVDQWAATSLPVHPTQLYESLFGLICFPLLLYVFSLRPPPGLVFFTGMFWYGVYRFSSEWIRGDSGGLHPFGLMTFAQLISCLIVSAAVFGILLLNRIESSKLRDA